MKWGDPEIFEVEGMFLILLEVGITLHAGAADQE